MIIPLVALVHPLTSIALPNDKYEFCNQIQNFDLVCVARVEAFLGETVTHMFTTDGKEMEDPLWYLQRYRLVTLLNCTENGSNDFTYVVPSTTKLNPELPVGFPGQGDIHPGDTCIVFGTLPGSDGYWIYEDRKLALGAHEYCYLGSDSYRRVPVPTLNYVLEGSTPNQRLMSVFSQVYASDPNRYREFLYHMMSPAPSWVEEKDGSIRFTIEGFRDANIFNFFREKIEPRLIRAAGNDRLRQLWVTYFRAQAANPSLKGEYFAKLDELERTYPNPNEQGLVPGVLRPKPETREFWLQKIRSRLSTVRKFSLFGLEMKRYNLEPVIEVLKTEESWEVLGALKTFFQGVKDSETPPYRDAPSWKLDQKTKTLTNRAEIIEYWSTRAP